MEDLRVIVTPFLEKARDVILKVSEFISNGFQLDLNNVHLIVLVLLSFFVGRTLFNLFHVKTEGRMGVLILIIGIIFYFLKFF